MKSLLVFVLPSLLYVSLVASQEPYKPEGKLPEDFSFRKCDDDDDKDCIESRTSFMKQYKHHRRNNGLYVHNFFMNNDQTLHISSNQELIVYHDVKNNRIDIRVKSANKDTK